jgi:cephalosporin hydroxylase
MIDLQGEYEKRAAEPGSDIALHLPFLHDAVASRQAPVVVELGTRSGNSTAAFLAAVVKNGGVVWSVDLDLGISPASFPWGTHVRWNFVRGDSIAPEVLRNVPSPDVLFVDTSHTYEQTLAECRAWVPRVKPGGVALFHDTQYHPFYNWQPDYDLGEPTGPVGRALDAYCKEASLVWENRPGSYGLGVIQL